MPGAREIRGPLTSMMRPHIGPELYMPTEWWVMLALVKEMRRETHGFPPLQ